LRIRRPTGPDIAWGVHRIAETPEYLAAIIAGAPKGTKITQAYIEGIRKAQADTGGLNNYGSTRLQDRSKAPAALMQSTRRSNQHESQTKKTL
jgi:hypothetical protein